LIAINRWCCGVVAVTAADLLLHGFGLNFHIFRLFELLCVLRLLWLMLLMLRVALDLILSLLESVALEMAVFHGACLILVRWLFQARFDERLRVALCILVGTRRLNESCIMITDVNHLIQRLIPVVQCALLTFVVL